MARQVERVEFDIIHATTLLSVIVCDWGVLELRPTQAMLLDEEELPDAESIPWDKYDAAGLYAWRIVGEGLARFIIDLWRQICPSSIPVTVTYHGSDLEL